MSNACEGRTFTKSSRSAADCACVEVARGENGVAIRDSKSVPGPMLEFPNEVWRAFVADVCAGRFRPDRAEYHP